MNFNNIGFLFVFLPLVGVAFYTVPRSKRMLVLLVSSLIFYAAENLIPLSFLVVSTLWGFVLAFVVERNKSRLVLSVAISLPLIILFLFKYLNFTFDAVNASPEIVGHFSLISSVVLPAGISFYTFEVVSYLIDVRDGRVSARQKLSTLTTFVAFFPHLIAGPILRYNELAPQLERLDRKVVTPEEFFSGLKLLSIGLFLKTFFSDVLSLLRDSFSLAGGNSLDAMFSVISYSFVIYYDFGSYSLMAIGLARMFGVELPRNFIEPYLSKSPKDFWRRWHVTLGTWLRDYVYLRIGGNRRYVANILIVFAACGLWHGAGWNFLVWGLYHAFFVILYHLTRPWWDRAPGVLQIGTTFMIATFGWPLFYLSIDQYLGLLRVIGSFDLAGQSIGLHAWAYLLVVSGWTFFIREDAWIYNQSRNRLIDRPVLLAGMAFIACLMFSFSRTFIYFQF